MSDIAKAIKNINSSAKFTIANNDIDKITWLNGTAEISKEDIQAKINETAYMNKRANEYPSWQDQMDMQYWDKINNTSTWQDAVQAVKDKYPKS